MESNFVKENVIKTEQTENFGGSVSGHGFFVRKIFKYILVFFVFILIAGGVFFAFFYDDIRKGIDDGKEEVILEPEGEKLEGEIYLTLSPLGTNKPNIYRLDFETMALEEFFPNSEFANYMAKFSPDGSKMVFLRGYPQDITSQILVLEVETGDLMELTQRKRTFPRNPTFSPEGDKIVYWVYENISLGDWFGEKPEDSSIYIVDLNGNEEKVAQGAFPLFTPDGESILYLKLDGIYSLNLKTKEEFPVLTTREEYLEDFFSKRDEKTNLPHWLTIRFNISPKNNLFIYTDTITSVSHILQINSWDNFEYEFLPNLRFVGPNWPTFSPEGDYLAVQDFDADLQNTQLSLYNLETLEHVGSVSLALYDQNNIWITDWIVK